MAKKKPDDRHVLLTLEPEDAVALKMASKSKGLPKATLARLALLAALATDFRDVTLTDKNGD